MGLEDIRYGGSILHEPMAALNMFTRAEVAGVLLREGDSGGCSGRMLNHRLPSTRSTILYHYGCVCRTLWQVMTEEELGDAAWIDLENIDENGAKSRYYMENTTSYEGFINGIISVAFWSTDVSDTPSQFYYLDGDPAFVDGLECTGSSDADEVGVYHGDDTKWGTVYECEKGPSLTNEIQEQHTDKTSPPPTILMTRSDGEVSLIVEESSSYPSFLYSIWTTGNINGTSTELVHKFHIAATMRLAEAVVTGIVHGDVSGGTCFGLLRKFSESREPYGSVALRASPFGEHPAGDSVQIEQLENVEVGLEVNGDALLCFVWLMALTSIGIMWSFCLRSSIGMDVYDRDELIRAVSITGAMANDDASPTEMRIFVRKEDTGDMRVVINDTGDARAGCARILRRGGAVVEDADPAPTVSPATPCNDGFGGAIVPMGSRTVVLEGVRMRQSRHLPGPSGNFRYPTSISLTASPVPSNSCSASATPASCSSPPSLITRKDRGGNGGRGASILFDSSHSPSGSKDGETDAAQVVCGKPVGGNGISGALKSASSRGRALLSSSQRVHPFDSEAPRGLDRTRGDGLPMSSPGTPTTDVNKASSPLHQVVLTRDLTFGPPQLDPLALSGEELT